MSALARLRQLRPGRPRLGALGAVGQGVVAVCVKELRGRMRGRRAFVMLTVNLVLVAGFAWMVELLFERQFSAGFGSLNASADLGRNLFIALMLLQTLIVLILAPASTAGAISLEREKQTLDLLVATPISSLAIILGKLVSALSWMLLLLLASIPITALVFTFGGVAPDDVIRGYVVLLVTAFAYGSIGLFFSAVVRRTQAATILNLVAAIALTAGTTFVFVFWNAMSSNSGAFPDQPGRDDGGLAGLTQRPPEALMWLNPFVAQADVICGTETGLGGFCSIVGGVTNQPVVGFVQPQPMPPIEVDGKGGAVIDDVAAGPQPFGLSRDSYWPRSLAAMAGLSLLLVILSVQLVSPTRRWRLRVPSRRGRPTGSSSDAEPLAS